MCHSELTEFLAELTEFAAELSELSLLKQYSRYSIPPVPINAFSKAPLRLPTLLRMGFVGRRMGWALGPSDILFPYRTPSPRPHLDPTQHPKTRQSPSEMDRIGLKWTEIGRTLDMLLAFWGGGQGGFVGEEGGL